MYIFPKWCKLVLYLESSHELHGGRAVGVFAFLGEVTVSCSVVISYRVRVGNQGMLEIKI